MNQMPTSVITSMVVPIRAQSSVSEMGGRSRGSRSSRCLVGEFTPSLTSGEAAPGPSLVRRAGAVVGRQSHVLVLVLVVVHVLVVVQVRTLAPRHPPGLRLFGDELDDEAAVVAGGRSEFAFIGGVHANDVQVAA